MRKSLILLPFLLFHSLAKGEKFYTQVEEIYCDPELRTSGLLYLKKKDFEVLAGKVIKEKQVEENRYFLIYHPLPNYPFKLKIEYAEVLPELKATVIKPYRVEVEAKPSTLKAGSGGSISLFIEVRDINGEKVKGAKLEVKPTEGSVRNCREENDGIYKCQFYPSHEKYPRITVIEVKAEDKGGKGVGWTVIAQKGVARIKGETEPGSKVELFLEERKITETIADEKGNFSAPVEVGPGYDSIEAKLTDLSGNVLRKKIKFELPPPPRRIYYFAYPSSLQADGVSQAKVLIYAVDRFGNILKNININTEKGRIKFEREGMKALYTAPFIQGEGEETDRIELITPDGAKDQVFIKLIRFALPGEVNIKVDTKTIPADGTGAAKIYLNLYDAFGNPLDLSFSWDVKNGELKNVKKEGVGFYIAEIKGPPRLVNKYMEVLITSKSAVPIRKGVRIPLTPGSPQSLNVLSAPYTLVADGKTEGVIRIEVIDRGNNPVSGLNLRGESSEGKVGEVIEEKEGRYRFTYTSPLLRREKEVKVTIYSSQGKELGGLKIFLSPKPFFLVLSPQIGFISNAGKVNSITPGLRVLFRTLLFKKRLFSFLEWDYYSTGSEYNGKNEYIGDYRIKTSIELHSFFVGILYSFYLTDTLSLPAGIGGGVAYERIRVAPSFQEAYSLKGISWTTRFFTGLEYRIGIGRIFFEIGYSYSPPHKPKGRFLKVEGNLGGISTTLGYRFEVF